MAAKTDWVTGDIVDAAKMNALGAEVNGRQPTLSLTTTGTSGAATLVSNVLNVPQYGGGGGGDPSAATHAAASKATPVDADEVPLVDSAASFGLKRLTWANLKAAIKAYYDPLTATLTNKTISGATNTLSNIPNASVTGLGPLATLTPTGTASATTYLSGTGVYSTPAGSGGGNFVDPLEFQGQIASIGASTARRAYAAQTLTGARMRAATAPVGSSLIAQIQHSTDDTTYTTIGTLTMTTGSRVEQSTTFTQAQSIGHYLRVNITSVGSTTAATGVAVDVTRTVP